MRVFKFGVVFSIILYIFCITIEQIYNKYEAGIKFQLIEDNNKTEKNNRFIIYGSSHCDFGLSAEILQKELKTNTFNLCNYGIERKIYEKSFIKKLKSLTNEDDTIIYSFRINKEKIPVEESGIIGLLLPQFRTTTNDLIRVHFQGKKSFNSFGDRIYYPNFKKEFNYPEYSINYDLINNHIKNKIENILYDENFKSKLIVVITPMLIKNKNIFDVEKIFFDCKKNCENFLGIQSPLLIEDKKYFLLPWHFNPSHGRELWTNTLVKFIKKINIGKI
jgi:hypothetical protein